MGNDRSARTHHRARMGLLRWRRSHKASEAMSDTRFQPVDAPEREVAKEPPKRWRNWWRIRVWVVCRDCGHDFWPGSQVDCDCEPAHPSYDVAMTRAAEQTSVSSALLSGYCDAPEHIGAFPEGEQPKRQN